MVLCCRFALTCFVFGDTLWLYINALPKPTMLVFIPWGLHDVGPQIISSGAVHDVISIRHRSTTVPIGLC